MSKTYDIITENQKIPLIFPFYIYFVLLLSCLTGDIINFICYVFALKISFIFIFITLICLPLYFMLGKRFFKFSKLYFTISDIIPISIIILLGLFKLPLPDTGYDTMNYHIYIQQFHFADNINNNFLPAGMGTFYFPLADGVFYVFRFLLGYRAGTLLNPLILVLVYFQTRSILKCLCDGLNFKINLNLLGLFSILPIITEFILANLSLYMIDLVAIPILLELLSITIFDEREHTGYKFFAYAALLAGIIIGLKYTFSIFCIPILICFVIKNKKRLRPANYFICAILLLTPCTIYLIYNYLCTGNPVFPFYNGVFQSQYASKASFNFKDTFGPRSLVEYLIWPIYVIFRPSKLSELSCYTGRIGMGYLVLIFTILMSIIKKEKIRNQHLLVFLYGTFLVFWELTTGYIRYALFMEVIAGILVIILGLQFIYSYKNLSKVFGVIVIGLLITQCFFSIYIYTFKNLDWSWRPSVFIDTKNYVNNIAKICTDYEFNYQNDALKKVDAWLVIDNNSGYMVSLKSDIPVFNLHAGWGDQKELMESYFNIIQKCKNKKLYTLSLLENYNRTLQLLKDRNLEIGKTIQIGHPLLPIGKKMLLIEIKDLQSANRGNFSSEDSKLNLGSNIIKDDSFENYLQSANVSDLKNWIIPDINSQVIIGEKAKDGKVYVKASVEKPITQVIKVDSNKEYKLSFFARADEKGKGSTRLQINWCKGSKFLLCSINVVESNMDWQNFSMNVISPDEADSAIIYVNSHDKYFIDFDKIEFVELK